MRVLAADKTLADFARILLLLKGAQFVKWMVYHILRCRSGLTFDDILLVYVKFSVRHLLSDWVYLGAKIQIQRAHTHTHPYTAIDL